jgi:hypothetical protein
VCYRVADVGGAMAASQATAIPMALPIADGPAVIWPSSPLGTSNPIMAGLFPVISTRTEYAKDAIPVSKHPMEMAEPNLAKPDHDGVSGACSTSTAKTAGISPGHDESAARCRYVNASYIDPCVLG